MTVGSEEKLKSPHANPAYGRPAKLLLCFMLCLIWHTLYSKMNCLDRYIARQMKNAAFRKRVEQEVAELEVGILIARLRQSLKMNQTELAARAGMNASKISRMESSPKNVTLNTLTRVAQALNRRVKISFVPAEGKVVFAHKRDGGLGKIRAKSSRSRGE